MEIIGTARFGLALAVCFSLAACSTVRTGEDVSTRAVATPENPVRESSRYRSPAELASYARDAVVSVIAFKDGEVLQSGTGFFIRGDGVLVTNLHVVAGAEKVSIELSNGEVFDNVYVLGRDDRRDLVLLQIPAKPSTFLSVTDNQDISIGELVYVIGNPLGLQGTFSNGLVSGKRIEEGVTYIQITAPISGGSSGGPVMNEEGIVIGVATSFYTDGQNLNMAVPAWHVSGILALAGAPTRFEMMAADLITEEQRLVKARADQSRKLFGLLPQEARASFQDLDEYQKQTATRVFVLGAYMAEEGWRYLGDLTDAGTLASDGFHSMDITLDRGSYVVAGLCDDDCTDLDIGIMDGAKEFVAIDTEADPQPVVGFDVPYRQTYAVAVEMVNCAAADCVYSIAVFRQD